MIKKIKNLDTLSKTFILSTIAFIPFAVFIIPSEQNTYIQVYFLIVALLSSIDFSIQILKHDSEQFGVLKEYKYQLLIASAFLIFYTGFEILQFISS